MDSVVQELLTLTICKDKFFLSHLTKLFESLFCPKKVSIVRLNCLVRWEALVVLL